MSTDEEMLKIRDLVAGRLNVEQHPAIPTYTMVKMLADLLDRYREIVGDTSALEFEESKG